MPNWCTNQVTITGAPAQIDRLMEEARDPESSNLFSLQQLVPCPQSLRDVTSGSSEMAYELKYGDEAQWRRIAKIPWVREANDGVEITSREEALRVFGKLRPDDMAMADLYKHNVDTYGCPTWYEWRCQHWGTKWDIEVEDYDDYEDHVCFRFDSAWSPPVEALLTISKRYPELTFRLEFYEEGMDFIGFHEYEGGKVLVQNDGSCSEDADGFEFAPEPEEDWDDEDEEE